MSVKASKDDNIDKEAIKNASKFKKITNDLMAGFTVALALVPVSVAFAFMAGVPPSYGLYCTIVVGLISSLVGGRPGMITAATSALAVVMAHLVIEHGVEYLLAATILMGALQVLAGINHLGKFIRLVPTPAIYGFVNGLAIVIFMSQLDHFKVHTDTGELIGWIQGTELWMTLGLIALTMFIIHIFPKITKAIPASLAGVAAVTLIVYFLKLDVRTVNDVVSMEGGLPKFHLPNVPFSLEAFTIILPYAFIFAAIGLIESLITMSLVDDITDTHGRGNKECIGQGVGNFVAGLFGGFGACATVGPTMINLKSAGRGRLSGVTASLVVLAFLVIPYDIIGIVPIPALVGLMFIVVMATFAWSTFRIIHKIPRSDAFVLLSVTIVTVFEDLASAVLIGVIISALVFAWEHAKNTGVRIFVSQGKKTYKIYGPLFFGSVKTFSEFFDPENDPKLVTIDFKRSRVCDHSAIEAIDSLADKYRDAGVELHLLHLSPECKQLLAKASDFVDEDIETDPTYHIMTDRLD